MRAPHNNAMMSRRDNRRTSAVTASKPQFQNANNDFFLTSQSVKQRVS